MEAEVSLLTFFLSWSDLILGGTGGNRCGAGGGAGGLIYNTSYPVTAGQVIPISVGAGGVGVTGLNQPTVALNNGQNSSFGVLTTIGGGGGGGAYYSGLDGGSGGGFLADGGVPYTRNGFGTAGQGNNGGYQSTHYFSGVYSASGGGGAGAAGLAGNATRGGNGGNGRSISITGSAVFYAGGGGGAAQASSSGYSSAGGVAGLGGAGAGAYTVWGSTTGFTGGQATFYGSGGGGGGGTTGSVFPGGNGFQGIVIIAFNL